MILKIRGGFFEQNNKKFLFGIAKVKDILEKMEIDTWSQSHREGYQREVTRYRAKSFGKFMAEGGISPTAILLNIRSEGLESFMKKNDHEFEIPDEVKVWVVDGQHRLKGFEIVGEQNPDLLEIEMPVLVTSLGGNDDDLARYREALQFYIINKTQKGVRSDLVERILYTTTIREGRERIIKKETQETLPESLISDVEWKPKAIEIVDSLNARQDSPLKGKIRLPNLRYKGNVVSQVSVVASLKDFVKSEDVKKITKGNTETMTSALINYWQATKELCPEPFEEVEETGKANEYVLLKTTGIYSMNMVLPKIIVFCRKNNEYLLTKDSFKRILSKVAQKYINSVFWNSNGTAGNLGTSLKTFNHIADLIAESIIYGIDRGEEDSFKVVV